MTGGGNIREQVKAYVAQIEMTEAEIAELNADKSETYKSAKEAGLDVAALRNVIAYRRKRAKHGAAAMESAEQATAEYLAFLGDGTGNAPRARARARETSTSSASPEAVSHGDETPGTNTPEGRSGTAREAPSTGSGTPGGDARDVGVQPAAPSPSVDATVLLPPDELPDIPTFLRRVQ